MDLKWTCQALQFPPDCIVFYYHEPFPMEFLRQVAQVCWRQHERFRNEWTCKWDISRLRVDDLGWRWGVNSEAEARWDPSFSTPEGRKAIPRVTSTWCRFDIYYFVLLNLAKVMSITRLFFLPTLPKTQSWRKLRFWTNSGENRKKLRFSALLP